MNKFLKMVMISLCLVLAVSAAVFAQDASKITIEDANVYTYSDDNFNAKIVTPKISGMADEAKQKDLNDYFAKTAADLQKQFEDEKSEAIAEGTATPNTYGLPHFGYTFTYEVVTDTDKIFAFDTQIFYAAGSSSTDTQYFTIDKSDGHLVTLAELFPSGTDYMTAISDYVRAQMTELNKDGNHAYYEGTDLDDAFKSIPTLNHYYVDDKGGLVVFFDKYQVAPGAYGRSTFVIPGIVYGK